MYDYPYRVEEYAKTTRRVEYAIYKSGLGVICVGTDLFELRKLAEIANEAASVGITRSIEPSPVKS